jgi:hypothetical protein
MALLTTALLTLLQAELLAECPETAPDYRGGVAILDRSLHESGLEGQTFVRSVRRQAARAVGGAGQEMEVEAEAEVEAEVEVEEEVEVPLDEGAAAVAVTQDNKREWLTALLQGEMIDGYTEAAAHFRKGFVDVVGIAGHVDPSDPNVGRWVTPYFFLLSPAELSMLWSGASLSIA